MKATWGIVRTTSFGWRSYSDKYSELESHKTIRIIGSGLTNPPVSRKRIISRDPGCVGNINLNKFEI
jgi:hypothetical protein